MLNYVCVYSRYRMHCVGPTILHAGQLLNYVPNCFNKKEMFSHKPSTL